MTKLAEHLQAEIERWGEKSYAELVAIEYPHVYSVGRTGESDWYEVEATLLEKNDHYVHVSLAISDGGLSSFVPKSSGVIAYSNARKQSQTERLRRAVYEGSLDEIVRVAADGGDVNSRDEFGRTSLSVATSEALGPKRALACIRCLLSLGARVSEERPQSGLLNMGTSVHEAADNGYTEALRELLAADGTVALNTFDDSGRTPLIRAVQRGNFEAASILLNAGSDINAHDEATNSNTALAHAVDEKNLPIVELLLNRGADPTIEGWMKLTAVDHARELVEEDTALEPRRILELLKAEAQRRKAVGGTPGQ